MPIPPTSEPSNYQARHLQLLEWMADRIEAISQPGEGGLSSADVATGIDASGDIEFLKTMANSITIDVAQTRLKLDTLLALSGAGVPTVVTEPSLLAGAPVELYTFPGIETRVLFLTPPPGENWLIDMVYYWWGGSSANGPGIPLALFPDRATAVDSGFRLVSLNFYHPYSFTGNPIKPIFCRTAPSNNFPQSEAGGKEFYIQMPFTWITSEQCLMFSLPAGNSPYYISYRVVYS